VPAATWVFLLSRIRERYDATGVGYRERPPRLRALCSTSSPAWAKTPPWGRVPVAAAVPVALAWPFILCAAVLALRGTGRSTARVAGGAFARSLLLVAYAAAIPAAARALGAAETIHGDAPWTAVWLAAAAGWVAVSLVCPRRAER
jgi:hypothetical protein